MRNNRYSSQSNASGEVGFTSLLQLAFIVLKLTHVIEWSWFWVLSPTIFSIGLVILAVVIGFIVAEVHKL